MTKIFTFSSDKNRVRPQNSKEIAAAHRVIVQVLDEHVLIFDPPVANNVGAPKTGRVPRILSKKARDYRYAFDQLFHWDASGEEVYEKTVKHLIQPVLDGYNATVFAYGATGKASFVAFIEYSDFSKKDLGKHTQ